MRSYHLWLNVILRACLLYNTSPGVLRQRPRYYVQKKVLIYTLLGSHSLQDTARWSECQNFHMLLAWAVILIREVGNVYVSWFSFGLENWFVSHDQTPWSSLPRQTFTKLNFPENSSPRLASFSRVGVCLAPNIVWMGINAWTTEIHLKCEQTQVQQENARSTEARESGGNNQTFPYYTQFLISLSYPDDQK